MIMNVIFLSAYCTQVGSTHPSACIIIIVSLRVTIYNLKPFVINYCANVSRYFIVVLTILNVAKLMQRHKLVIVVIVEIVESSVSKLYYISEFCVTNWKK